jgi:hypothetical protein
MSSGTLYMAYGTMLPYILFQNWKDPPFISQFSLQVAYDDNENHQDIIKLKGI